MPRTDDHARKLHPWLRVVKNGDQVVNVVRSDGSARMARAASVETEGLETAPIGPAGQVRAALDGANGAAAEGTKKREYFAELEEHVEGLKDGSGGRLKLHFNRGRVHRIESGCVKCVDRCTVLLFIIAGLFNMSQFTPGRALVVGVQSINTSMVWRIP